MSFVSIITPCYNAENYISQTIESVISQTYTDWEMLIIDDCSTDNSAKIVNEYCNKDSRIKYLKTPSPSGSPSQPRNIGIEKASGEYIAFLDADDIWLPEKLQKQINFIKSYNYKFIYSDYEKINDVGIRRNRIIKMPVNVTFWDIIETCSIPCLTVLISSDTIGTTRFKNIPKEDFAFWLEILKKGIKAYNIGETLALYREQSQSRSANKFNMIRNQWYILRKVEGVKPIIATYFLIIYIFNGLIKYIK